MTQRSGLNIMLFTVLALAAPAFANDYPSSGRAGVPSLDHTGDYIVPAPAELASVSAFKIRYGVGESSDGRKILAYQLPDLIAGPKKPVIVLTQTGPVANGFIPFANKFDSANCRLQSDDITCFVLYPNMDTTGSEDVVKQQFAGAADLDLRLQLARVFSADPKGVLYIKLF